LKPYQTPKDNKQEKSKKKKKFKEKQGRKQTTNEPPARTAIATDSVRRGRLPKFRNEGEAAESNSNPDEETAMNRSGSPSRCNERG
jgi:hypothetical protein